MKADVQIPTNLGCDPGSAVVLRWVLESGASVLSVSLFLFRRLYGVRVEKEMATHSICSCLENPRDGGVWWAAVCGVAQSRTRLSSSSSSSSEIQNSVLIAPRQVLP